MIRDAEPDGTWDAVEVAQEQRHGHRQLSQAAAIAIGFKWHGDTLYAPDGHYIGRGWEEDVWRYYAPKFASRNADAWLLVQYHKDKGRGVAIDLIGVPRVRIRDGERVVEVTDESWRIALCKATIEIA